MNVLLDHCLPKQFGHLLVGHFVRTAKFMKWSDLRNGELLRAGAVEYTALVTVDKRLRFEQNIGELPMGVIALVAQSNKLCDLAPLVPEVLRLLSAGLQRQVYVVPSPKGS